MFLMSSDVRNLHLSANFNRSLAFALEWFIRNMFEMHSFQK